VGLDKNEQVRKNILDLFVMLARFSDPVTAQQAGQRRQRIS
jgi:hypothetical protein